ncbi:YdhR family protein [Fischerella thermalis]|uniref:Putative mono-oxygenase ydhR n=2 Tax=Fischerella TaxID=1190 RepID=G6FVR9_9CYAN|nr:YdhR family protein [Fischerella thermalis]EHC11558.1 Putative mono-oxygenase ydhR [Fischerella thermalis JSC-11]
MGLSFCRLISLLMGLGEMTQAYSELGHKLSETPGLLWKIWIENSNDGETGGIYLFEDVS